MLVYFHYGGKREEILELLSDKGFQCTETRQRVHFQIASDILKDKAEMFVQIAELKQRLVDAIARPWRPVGSRAGAVLRRRGLRKTVMPR